MSLRTSGRRRKRGIPLDGEELNLLPLMSLFVALVPTLLYSAVFVPVSALGIDFPGTGGTASASPLALTVRLTETTVGIDGVPGQVYEQRDRSTAEAHGAAMESLRVDLDTHHGQYLDARGALLVVTPLVPYRDSVALMDVMREAGFGNSTPLGAQSVALEPAP